jgi:predicted O-methyltransferase YrrM
LGDREKIRVTGREIVDLDTSVVAEPLRYKDKKEFRQIQNPIGHNYKTLIYLAKQYRNSLFFDLGTKRGGSAYSLAIEPSNTVVSYDVQDEDRKKADYPNPGNIIYKLEDVWQLRPHHYDNVDLIFLDVDPHNGKNERRFLDILEASKFSGLLLMDDIDWKKFPALSDLWSEIKRPKWKLTWAHFSGLGLVSYGTEVEFEAFSDN